MVNIINDSAGWPLFRLNLTGGNISSMMSMAAAC